MNVPTAHRRLKEGDRTAEGFMNFAKANEILGLNHRRLPHIAHLF